MKKRVTFLLMALSVLLCSVGAYAQQAEVLVETDGIKISGTADAAGSEYMAAVFAKSSDATFTDDNIGKVLVALVQDKTNTTGSFTKKITLGDIASGNYIVEISFSGNFESVIPLEFYYLAASDRKAITEQFVSAEMDTASELQTLTEQYSDVLNIAFDGIYTQVKSVSDVYEKMLAAKAEKDFSDSTQIKAAFDEACVLSALSVVGNTESYAKLLTDYASVLGVDLSELSSDEVLAASALLMKKSLQTTGELKAVYNETVCAAKFNVASRNKAEALIAAYSDYITIPSAYQQSGATAEEKRLALYKKIESKTDFTSYSDISGFIKTFYDSYNGGSGGSTGGGSSWGGGSIGGGYAPSSPVANSAEAEPTGNATSQLTPATNFTDLAGYEWAFEAIEYLANQKIILGVSSESYEPERDITREEFVKLIVEAFDIPTDTSASFSDVPVGAWYREYVSSACASGIVEGVGDGSFGTGRSITRQEMAVIMSRIIKSKNITALKDDLAYEDAADVADWAKTAVGELSGAGILNGVGDNRFAPNDSVNRAMAAKAVYQLMNFTENQGGAAQ
ncbi:MAG: S-layer homology domain-containing protein [Clostridia bacterium]|nr:S-layer homology domain-containing protein [Clostridia bacterium]